MDNRGNASEQHSLRREIAYPEGLLNNEFIHARRKNLTPRTRAIYDDAVEYGLSGSRSAQSKEILARMAYLSEGERKSLMEIFDATSLGAARIAQDRPRVHPNVNDSLTG